VSREWRHSSLGCDSLNVRALSAPLFAIVAAAALSRAAPAADHTFTVNTTADGVDANPGDGACATSGGLCTVRAAVMESNHTASGTVEIVVPANASAYALAIPPSGIYEDEATGDLNIHRGVTITGGGAAHTIVDGNGTDRVFSVKARSTISGLTIRNGSVSSGGGGGILADTGSSVSISRCVVTANTANAGGGIYAQGMTTLQLDRSTVSGNISTTAGGGLAAQLATIEVSTISGNVASTLGGGLYLDGTGITIFYSTIAGNHTDFDNGAGGGIYSVIASGVSVTGTLIAGNYETIPTKPFPTLNPSDCTGNFVGSTNMVGTKSNCTITATEADPLLGPLQLNGGQLPTRALLAGSPAIGAGNPTSCAFNTPTDQRGAHRPAGSACDLGAYERNANGDVDGNGTRDVADVFYLINFLFAGGAAPNGLGDVNGDTNTDIADVFYLINFLFAGGPAPL
jgi:CSLREA domain-containing protein